MMWLIAVLVWKALPLALGIRTSSFHGTQNLSYKDVQHHFSRRCNLTMGIPKLFRWLTDQYPSINQQISEGLNQETAPIDNFYLDMNGIIHMATHNNADRFIETNEQEMRRRIFLYTDRLYKLVSPRRLMFLAVDGVAPRAKMNQQRARRFRSWWTICSVSRDFFLKLSRWRRNDLIETYILWQQLEKTFKPQSFLLAISAKEAEQTLAVLLARDGALPAGERFDSNCITPGTEFMYNLGRAFRSWIEFKLKEDPFWRNGARIIFSGPDVPGEGEHKVMDYIRNARKNESDWREGLRHCLYGLDADLIMLSLVTHEPYFSLLREKMSVRHSRRGKPKDPIYYRRDDFELLRISMIREMLRLQFREEAADSAILPFDFSLERIIDDFVFMCILVGNDFLPNMPHLDIADGALNSMLSIYKNLLPTLGGYLTQKEKIHRGRLEIFVQEISRREAIYFKQRGIEENNLAFQKASEYRKEYYATKLNVSHEDGEAIRSLVKHYLEGLYWVLLYYHEGIENSSWSWYYPHLYAPLGTDMKDLADVDIQFKKGSVFSPLMQLLSVLPSSSSSFLPGRYRELMTEESSPIIHFYPHEFECDANGKRQSWETVVRIPFIEEAELIEALKRIDHKAELNPSERIRNTSGKVWIYHPEGEKESKRETAAPPSNPSRAPSKSTENGSRLRKSAFRERNDVKTISSKNNTIRKEN